MKVLLITKTLKAKGGAGRHSNEIIKELRHSGINIRALTEQDTLIPFSRFAVVNFLINIFRIRKEAKNFDIIHAMDVWPYGVYGYFAVLGTKKKLFINGIGTYSVVPVRRVFKKFLIKQAYFKAKQVFCISEYTKKRILEGIQLDNICVVFYGTVELPFLTEQEIKDYKEIYNIKDEFPVLLTVGDIKERKGQFDTLQSAKLIKEQYPNFKYIIIGDDGDKYYAQKIKEYAEKNNLNKNYEIISGMYDNKTLSFFYQICDIFLMNSNNIREHFEGFGGVFLEAAQFGKPVIGSGNCGIESAMKNGYNGYLTEQGNIQDIHEKILKVLIEKERLSKNSKEFYKNFTWKKTVSEYIKYYKQAE